MLFANSSCNFARGTLICAQRIVSGKHITHNFFGWYGSSEMVSLPQRRYSMLAWCITFKIIVVYYGSKSYLCSYGKCSKVKWASPAVHTFSLAISKNVSDNLWSYGIRLSVTLLICMRNPQIACKACHFSQYLWMEELIFEGRTIVRFKIPFTIHDLIQNLANHTTIRPI